MSSCLFLRRVEGMKKKEEQDLTWKDYVIMSLMAFPVAVEYLMIIYLAVRGL